MSVNKAMRQNEARLLLASHGINPFRFERILREACDRHKSQILWKWHHKDWKGLKEELNESDKCGAY